MMFILSDKKKRVIKQNQNGMLCMFVLKADAERYLAGVPPNVRAQTEITERECILKKKEE
jgi:hypothetical protein